MKFLGLRRFTGRTTDDIAQYVGVELYKALTDMARGLNLLSFDDNFSTFRYEATIAQNATLFIPNYLRTPAVDWWIVGPKGLALFYEDPSNPFTKDVLPIFNASTTITPVTATIRFVRR